MKKKIVFFLACTSSILAAESATPSPQITPYLELCKQYPSTLGPLGSWKKGEIEIILEPELIAKIEKQARLRLEAAGYSEKDAANYSRVGIVGEDNYWIWLRDGVIFPSGVYGTYDRLLWKNALQGAEGVGVLLILKNKKILINLAYRHATRSWELELPRGQRSPQEKIEEAAKREMMEETGCTIERLTYLGEVAPDAGTIAVKLPIYLATASPSGDRHKEFSEAIPDNPSFTKERLKEGFAQGYLSYKINGKTEKVCCRDALLAYALFQAENKGLLP